MDTRTSCNTLLPRDRISDATFLHSHKNPQWWQNFQVFPPPPSLSRVYRQTTPRRWRSGPSQAPSALDVCSPRRWTMLRCCVRPTGGRRRRLHIPRILFSFFSRYSSFKLPYVVRTAGYHRGGVPRGFHSFSLRGPISNAIYVRYIRAYGFKLRLVYRTAAPRGPVLIPISLILSRPDVARSTIRVLAQRSNFTNNRAAFLVVVYCDERFPSTCSQIADAHNVRKNFIYDTCEKKNNRERLKIRSSEVLCTQVLKCTTVLHKPTGKKRSLPSIFGLFKFLYAV